MRIYLHLARHLTIKQMETNTRKVVRRLKKEKWLEEHGREHDKFIHPERPGVVIIVPRHGELSPGVARAIAKLAGWR
jgi:predicted RNA binding protein YcfA (HicA-like mRNA interferase family)